MVSSESLEQVFSQLLLAVGSFLIVFNIHFFARILLISAFVFVTVFSVFKFPLLKATIHHELKNNLLGTFELILLLDGFNL